MNNNEKFIFFIYFYNFCTRSDDHLILLTPPRRLSSYDDGEENAAHPHMMICRLRRNACIEERCQKGKEDLSQASFKYTHFAVAGKSSYEDERRSLRHHHMMISDAEGLIKTGNAHKERTLSPAISNIFEKCEEKLK